MNIVERYGIRGGGASGIVASVEAAIRAGRLAPGASLPTVRELARALRLSPTTVAAAYRTLRLRGLVHAQGRRGTRISPRPPLSVRPLASAPPHLRDLSLGNPDPALLPPLHRALGRLPRRPGLYGEAANRPALLALAARQLEAEGLPRGALAVTSGALDGIERVLQAHLRPGTGSRSRIRARARSPPSSRARPSVSRRRSRGASGQRRGGPRCELCRRAPPANAPPERRGRPGERTGDGHAALRPLRAASAVTRSSGATGLGTCSS